LTHEKLPHLRFVVDFGGPAVEKLPATDKLAADVGHGAEAGNVTCRVFKNTFNQTWRLVIETDPPRRALNLKQGDRPITESWNFTWQP
jgi:glucan biosynthesis protein